MWTPEYKGKYCILSKAEMPTLVHSEGLDQVNTDCS